MNNDLLERIKKERQRNLLENASTAVIVDEVETKTKRLMIEGKLENDK
jgi:hypothetical protein|nr:MAG TPA: hypothetical protein [Caudoviricetes sp.]